MKKSWSRVCFLVLAVSLFSRGQSETATTVSPHDVNSDSTIFLTSTPRPLSLDESESNATLLVSSSSSQNSTSVNATDLLTTASTTQGATENTDANDVRKGGLGTTLQTTALTKEPEPESSVDSVTTVTTSTSPTPVSTGGSGSSWGYVILVFIVLAIIFLCVILYLLRRASRTYSFDLQRRSPANHCNVPTGTFEPVYLDDLAPKDQVTTDDLSPPPVANGTTLQSEEKDSDGEQEEPDGNGVDTYVPILRPPDNTSDDESTNIFFRPSVVEQQNENNNNPSVCSSDPFVEINLDEPAWGDQLLTSPELPSSVLPFSPFSFSSSSSSSSSS